MSKATKVVGRMGAPVMGRLLAGRAVTVLCYHRVVEDVGSGMFPELRSATPEGFEQQLDLIGDSHEFIDEATLIAWSTGSGSLPDRPALLTFDDGYLDNYEIVYPILRRRGIPATFFLATEHIDNLTPLWWDAASLILHHTDVDAADLPLLGYRELSGSPADISKEWIGAAKMIPDAERRAAIEELSETLDVVRTGPADASMTWDQAREMAANGMSFGGHTHSHPILSRMDDVSSKVDIATGVRRVREELGGEVATFAYPNGGVDDFGMREKDSIRDLGIRLAFTLSSGPGTRSEIADDPMAIRRIYVGDGDDLDTMELKLAGVGRLLDRIRR